MQEWSLRTKASVSSKTAPGATIQPETTYPTAKEEITVPVGILSNGNYAYYPPPEPTFCCLIAKASNNRMHSRNCETTRQAA
jgi:hypothetical protein